MFEENGRAQNMNKNFVEDPAIQLTMEMFQQCYTGQHKTSEEV
jgi:hypothetical protein